MEGLKRPDLDSDRKLVLALLKAVEIVGEAAGQVSEETRSGISGVPWRDIVGMRNRLVHAYFDVNLDILWSTVVEDLPSLVAILRAVPGLEAPD